MFWIQGKYLMDSRCFGEIEVYLLDLQSHHISVRLFYGGCAGILKEYTVTILRSGVYTAKFSDYCE